MLQVVSEHGLLVIKTVSSFISKLLFFGFAKGIGRVLVLVK